MEIKQLGAELKSRLHSKHIPYDLFIFAKRSATVIIHITNSSYSLSLPYHIESKNNGNFILMYRNSEFEGTLKSIMSYIVTTMRREKSKFESKKN